MKTASDPRHQSRITRVQGLFSYTYGTEPTSEIIAIIPHLEGIDAKIKAAAAEWPLNQINRIDLAILREAVWEFQNQKEVPPQVIIDEAVEIGKTYGAESTPSFVNGVLGTILKSLK